jgi:hypothetical protein
LEAENALAASFPKPLEYWHLAVPSRKPPGTKPLSRVAIEMPLISMLPSAVGGLTCLSRFALTHINPDPAKNRSGQRRWRATTARIAALVSALMLTQQTVDRLFRFA